MNYIRLALSALLFFTFCAISAQNKSSVIKGKVTDGETGEALAGASVYFAETTIGTTASINGSFRLETSKPGNYELIVSMVGYSVKKENITIEAGGEYNFNIKLMQKPLDVKTVEVEGEDRSEWRNNLKIFTRKFLGTLEAADKCEIENKELINFKMSGDTLIAWAEKPVAVINRFLGYKVICEIVMYKYNPVTSYQEYSIFSRFEELTPKDKDEAEDWQDNREEAFMGSPVHFLWALRNNRLPDENFLVHIAPSTDQRSQAPLRQVKTWQDIMYGQQFMSDPVISFDAFLRIRYNNMQLSFVKSRFAMFTIDAYGIADNHLPFVCYGYWANLGVSNMLPRGWMPEKYHKRIESGLHAK